METIRNEIIKHLPKAQEARRLFHGRGHCFPGYTDLLIDIFPPVVLITLYQPKPQEWLRHLVQLLRDTLPQPPDAILLQERQRTAPTSQLLYGTLPEQPVALEAGLQYRLRLENAQNIGFFLDMAVGREQVRQRAKGKRVLNLFAYTCSFSVAALAGGATQVVNLDMNKGALQLGRENHRINQLDLRKVSFLDVELFRSFSKLRRLAPFDLVICDPPASQGKSFTAERHWPKLINRLPELLHPEGEVLACLNTPHLPPDFLEGHFHKLWPQIRQIGRYAPGVDFPEADLEKGVSLHHYCLGQAPIPPTCC